MIKKLNAFTGHTGSQYALEKLDLENFLSGSGDNLVAQWNLNKHEEGTLLVNVQSIVYSLLFLKDKNQLLIGQSAGGIHVLDMESKKEIRLLSYHKQGVFKLFESKKNNVLFALGGDGLVSVLSREDFALIKSIHLGNFKIRSICLDAEENNCFIGCGDGSVVVINISALTVDEKFGAHANGFSVNTICLSANENYLYTAARDARINVFDVKNNFKLLESIPAHNYAIYEMQFSPNKKYIATASRDKTIKIWDTENLKVLSRIDKEKNEGHVNSVNTLLWMSDDVLLTAGDDRSIISWQIEL